MRFKKIDKTPARLDLAQSLTGLILAIFISGHIMFEASILISHEMMYRVTIMFEGYYFFGETYPSIISFLAGAVSLIFVLHAGLAMRKFPATYKQYKAMRAHTTRLNHEDSNLWMLQVLTGFIMFFVGSVHLYIMMTQPANIGPFASANRVVEDNFAPLYFVLLLSVISHAFIGLYRLALKWGFLEGEDSKLSRSRFKKMMKALIALYIVVGLASLGKYIYIGSTHDFVKEPRYISDIVH